MKVSLRSINRNQGGALIITAVIVAFVAATLATYLYMIQAQYRTTIRSQSWNTALVVAESGTEEGLALINQYYGTTNLISSWTNKAVSQGWTSLANSATLQVYSISRTLTNGTYTVYVTNVLTAGADAVPGILSSGTANWNYGIASAAPPMFAASMVGGGTPTRSIYVQTTPQALITGGMIAIQGINFNGNTITMDSYCSSNPLASWFGKNGTNFIYKGTPYGIYTNTLRTAEIVVATLSAGSGILGVGNANIYGYVDTGPGGTASVGANGSVGDIPWVSAGTHGIQPKHALDDMNTSMPDVILPSPVTSKQANWLPVSAPSGGTNIGGTTYTYLITNNPALFGTNTAYYAIGNISANTYINASNVVLYLTNGMTLTGSEVCQLATNSNVKIYTGGTISTKGQASINNAINYAPAFGIYGLPSCTAMTFNGGANGYLYIYAPEATITQGGNGDVYGAYLCNSIGGNGTINFHFDTVLKLVEPPSQYVPTSWQEQ